MSAARDTCDKYASEIVRARGRCEWPGCHMTVNLQAAHIVRRRFVGDPDRCSLRTNPDNFWCMCAYHHRMVDEDPVAFAHLIEETIGKAAYEYLLDVKNGSHRPWRKADWVAERARLLAMKKALV